MMKNRIQNYTNTQMIALLLLSFQPTKTDLPKVVLRIIKKLNFNCNHVSTTHGAAQEELDTQRHLGSTRAHSLTLALPFVHPGWSHVN